MRLRARVRPRGEAGTTQLELMITITIMSMVMVVVTGAMLQIYRSVNKSESIAAARADINHVFTRLDKEIRYAAGISTPSAPAAGTDRYVEYLVTNTGSPTCVQLLFKASSGELKQRSWPQAGTPGSWKTLASGITATNPFTRYPATGDFAFQRLRIDVTATTGSGVTKTKRQTDITFTALNTSPTTSSNSVCTEGRLVP